MIIVGCDSHPRWQQVAVFDSSTGEIRELKLTNGNGEEQFSVLWPRRRWGLEACGNTQWFEHLVERCGHEMWIGDASEIRASYVRKQKTDKRDAAHILKLLMEQRFPRYGGPARRIAVRGAELFVCGQNSTIFPSCG
jgi:transposase